MAANQLTARKIENAKPEAKEYLLADGEGLYLRVRPKGEKDWFFIYSLNSKRSKLAIHAADLAGARQQANVYRDLLKRKTDPKQHLADEAQKAAAALIEAQRAQAALDSRLTVEELFDKWEAIDLKDYKNGSSEIRRSFNKDVFPTIGAMAAADITKAQVMSIVDNVLSRDAKRMAKLLFSQIRQMFRFAHDRGYVDHEPTATIRKANVFGPDEVRERVLSHKEIFELTKAIPLSGLNLASSSAIWIALATACRIGEISKAKWADVDLEARNWYIPPDVSKNTDAITVHLSDFALNHFRVLRSLTDSEYCIPNREGTSHIYTKAITKQIADRQKGEDQPTLNGRSAASATLILSDGTWRPHDLRRTAGTIMTELGVLPEIADRCLNHKEQNRIRRTYLRHSYESEKKAAWKLLGEKLTALTTPSSPDQ